MKKKFFKTGIPAIALVFGMMIFGCEEVKTFTVTFNMDGGTYNGSTNPVEITVNEGETIKTLPFPQKTNFDFGGWFTAKDGAGALFTSDTEVTSDLTVYAKWMVKANTEPKRITVTGLYYDGKNSPITGKVRITIIDRKYGTNDTTAQGEGTIANNNVTVQLKRNQLDWVLVGEELVDWTGNGSYLIKIEPVGQGIWYYTNGKTWAELEITKAPTGGMSDTFYDKLPKYNITETTSTISFDKFQNIVKLP